MVAIGDTVYLIYVGYVTVVGVQDDGSISVDYNGNKRVFGTSHYRTLDRMDAVRNKETIPDYTIK